MSILDFEILNVCQLNLDKNVFGLETNMFKEEGSII